MAARWVKVGRDLPVHLLGFLSALIDLSEIPHFAFGLDLLAFKLYSGGCHVSFLSGLICCGQWELICVKY